MTSVILAGKRNSRRHFFTIFRENVVVAEKSYQKLEFLSFLRSGEGLVSVLVSFNEHNSDNFSSDTGSRSRLRIY